MMKRESQRKIVSANISASVEVQPGKGREGKGREDKVRLERGKGKKEERKRKGGKEGRRRRKKEMKKGKEQTQFNSQPRLNTHPIPNEFLNQNPQSLVLISP